MNDQIIEKKPSSPLGTSLLAVSCFALIGAIVLLGMRLKDQTVNGAQGPTASAETFYKKNVKKVDDKVKKLLAEHKSEGEDEDSGG